MFKKITLLYFVFSVVIPAFNKPVAAQTSSYGELQAAYLYNFAKYITWPGEISTFKIGVLGDAQIMDDLQKVLKGKKVAGREIELKKISTPEEIKDYHIIYLSSDVSKELPSLLQGTLKKGILFVTEDDLAKKGATISFFVEDERLRFKINKKTLDDSGLKVADGLLKLGILL